MSWTNISYRSWKKYVLLLILLIWIIILLFILNKLYHQNDSIFEESNQKIQVQIDELTRELQISQYENAQLKRDLKLNKKNLKFTNNKKNQQLFSKEHEVERRFLRNLVQEAFYTLYNFSLNVHDKSKFNFNAFQNRVNEQLLYLLAKTNNFGLKIDNVSDWHKNALQNLTNRIQSKLFKLQHPADCSKGRFLICDLNKPCGFACQLHHIAYCLIIATASNRTMVLDNDGLKWAYSRNGWTAAFKPITNCSLDKFKENEKIFININQFDQIVRLTIIDALPVKVDQLPLCFPKQFKDELLTHHSNPYVFFIGQFINYLMQENAELLSIISKKTKTIPFNTEYIVGIHIRRTDKIGTEASFHSIDEYMKWTELWFRLQELQNNIATIKRRIFVATDDLKILEEIKEKYESYEVFYTENGAQTAQLKNRYNDASLHNIISDVRMLSKCNYLVCTFSSQVCRLAYELMQIIRGDAADNFHSLDDIYYYGGQLKHDLIAVGNYKTNNFDEIELRDGDLIGINGNHWNGFSKGTNQRTKKNGLFPSYLAKEHWKIVDFPIFNNI